MSKIGKTLFHQKAVTTPWLLGSPDNERQLYAGPLIAVSNTTVYLFVGSYLPETDDGYTYILAFSKDGNVNKYQMPQSLDESDLVTEFYLLYSHEYLTNLLTQNLYSKSSRNIAPMNCYGKSNNKANLLSFPQK